MMWAILFFMEGEKDLYLSRRANAAEMRCNPTQEEAFLAALTVMSRYDEYVSTARDLYDEYMAADEERRAAIFEEFRDIYNNFNLWRLGPKVVAQYVERGPYTNYGVQISGSGPFNSYSYVMGVKDVDKVEEWKLKIANLVKEIDQVLADPINDNINFEILSRIIGDSPERKDVERFALAYFLDKRRSSWSMISTRLRALVKMVLGGVNNVSSFGEQKDFCVDIALVGNFLADEMGYRARVENIDPSGNLMSGGRHHALVFEDGARIDNLWFPKQYGYLVDSSRYDELLAAQNGPRDALILIR